MSFVQLNARVDEAIKRAVEADRLMVPVLKVGHRKDVYR